MKGAEAVLKKTRILGIPAVEKLRVEKGYRAPELDFRIRRERTRREARLLARAKEAGVLCPTVFEVSDFSIVMRFLEGEMLCHALGKRRVRSEEMGEAARILCALHSLDIVHGDYTPANLMNTKAGMAVIDFGLGSISCDVEDKATDIVMMKRALSGKEGDGFCRAYGKAGGKKEVLRMVFEIEKRGRYMERG